MGLTRSVLLPPCIAGLFSSYDDSQLFQVVLLWSEFHLLSLVSLDRFSHHHESPASFPLMMTCSSPSCSSMVGIPSTEYSVSLDQFSYHRQSPASFSPTMTSSSPSRTFVVAILSTELCVSLDWFSYHHVTPASLPPTMTRNSPSGTLVVGIPSTEPCVSLDRFSYHRVLDIADLLLSYGDLQLYELYFCGRNSIY